jgi:hypothetical protein
MYIYIYIYIFSSVDIFVFEFVWRVSHINCTCSLCLLSAIAYKKHLFEVPTSSCLLMFNWTGLMGQARVPGSQRFQA